MRFHHLLSDAAGDSHWQDGDLSLVEKVFAPPAGNIEVSEPLPAAALVFLRLAAGWDEPAHPTPREQWLVCMTGRVRVTASDGAVREIGPGDVWLMADTSGKGHHTRVVSEDDFTCAIVQSG